MPQGLGVQLGLGGGRAATASGAPAGGGAGFSEVYSCKFDNSDDELAVGTLTELGTATSFTISLWADSDQESGAGHWTLFSSGTVTDKARIWWLWGNNLSYLIIGGDGVQKTVNTYLSHPSSTFHHLVICRDGDYVTSYVDGGTAAGGSQSAAVDCSAVSMPQSTYADDVTIGRYNTGIKTFNGNIDEVAVWDSALSAGTIADIYNSGVPTDLSSLSPVAWWRMGDSAGDTEDGGGAVTDGGTVGTVENAANPGTYDATGNNGTIYEAYVPS